VDYLRLIIKVENISHLKGIVGKLISKA